MKYLFKKKFLVLVIGLLFFAPACTDLEEELFSDVTDSNFFQTDEEFIAALGAAYSSMTQIGNHSTLWSINEISSDELVIATKGGDWFDGGVLIDLHDHTFTPANGFFNNAWTFVYGGINTCNRLIAQFGELESESAQAFIAELRGVRALWYYWALDAWGNVPLVIDFTDEVIGNASSLDAGRQAVFNFIESELNDIIDDLDPTVGGTAYGRFNQAAGYALRAKLYLNAEVWTGTARWADVVTAVDNIDGYSLSGSYRSNFVVENQGSTENIFVVPYDKVFATGFNWPAMTLHYNNQDVLGLTFQPWNGYATVEEFYNSYIDPVSNPGPQGPVWTGLADFDPVNPTVPNGTGTLDARLSNFIVGPQLLADGTIVEDPSFEQDNPASGVVGDPDGAPLNFTPEINEIWPNGWRQGGARIGKYEFEQGATENLSNDFVIFRYADMMLTKAEAMYRNGDAAGALAIVNEIRARAGVDPFTALTDENLLAERGREMYAEMTRRNDLIRFGRWGDAWWEKPASGSTYEVFPIPQPQIDVSNVLNQNPGY